MADLAGGGQAPGQGDDVVAGQARRLVDQDDAVAGRRGAPGHIGTRRPHASASSGAPGPAVPAPASLAASPSDSASSTARSSLSGSSPRL